MSALQGRSASRWCGEAVPAASAITAARPSTQSACRRRSGRVRMTTPASVSTAIDQSVQHVYPAPQINMSLNLERHTVGGQFTKERKSSPFSLKQLHYAGSRESGAHRWLAQVQMQFEGTGGGGGGGGGRASGGVTCGGRAGGRAGR